MEKLSSLPVQAQGLIDDSPGGSAVPIALGAAQRRPGAMLGLCPRILDPAKMHHGGRTSSRNQ